MARRAKLGAGYRRRTDGRIEYRWTGQDGKRYSVSGKTIEECKEKEQKKRQALERGSYTGNPEITLDAFFKEWQRAREGAVKASSLSREKSMYKVISKTLGRTRVCKIERRQVQAFQDSLKEKYHTNYINSLLKLLTSILAAAVIDDIIEKNPCYGIKSLKRTEPEARETIHRALTLEETDTFFQVAKKQDSWFYDLYDFLINTGCRIGEAGALQRQDIDIRNNVIHIRRTVTATETGREIGTSAKTENSKRDIPMNAEIRAILQRQGQRNVDLFGESVISMTDTVFKAINGGLVTADVIRRDIMRILKETDIEYFSVHAFRDTFATRAIESGMNPQTLKEILGHGSYAMTMDLYGHVMENTKQKEMDLVSVRRMA